MKINYLNEKNKNTDRDIISVLAKSAGTKNLFLESRLCSYVPLNVSNLYTHLSFDDSEV